MCLYVLSVLGRLLSGVTVAYAGNSLSLSLSLRVYIYIYVCACVCIYTYILTGAQI